MLTLYLKILFQKKLKTVASQCKTIIFIIPAGLFLTKLLGGRSSPSFDYLDNPWDVPTASTGHSCNN